jgi:hypothetical protein
MIHDIYSQGVYALMQGAGLGKLKPNVVVMGYSSTWLTSQVPNAHFIASCSPDQSLSIKGVWQGVARDSPKYHYGPICLNFASYF